MITLLRHTCLSITVISLTMALAACEHPDETPEVNTGYKTNIKLPDPSYLTDEDRAVIAAQEEEYETNVK